MRLDRLVAARDTVPVPREELRHTPGVAVKAVPGVAILLPC